jgi:hypothetical protein
VRAVLPDDRRANDCPGRKATSAFAYRVLNQTLMRLDVPTRAKYKC